MSDSAKGYSAGREFLKDNYLPTTNCEVAKKQLEELKLDIANYSKKALGSSFYAGYLKAYQERLSECEAYFKFGDCVNYFNKKKVDFLGEIINKESKEYEEIVRKDTVKQNTLVIGIGSLIMALGLIVILKKR